ncbi:MAG TPA: hypothetical protein VGJ60_07505 [Chloroflexota bacterium]
MYLVSGFTTDTPLMRFVNADGAWGACEFCAKMIDADRLGDLVDRVLRLGTFREMIRDPRFVPIVKLHVRQVYAEILRHRSDGITTDDPRAVALAHPDDSPIGVAWRHNRDGSLDIAPIPPAPPHPLRP